MGKKGVPEWLNSSLWSSGPSSANTTDDPRLAQKVVNLVELRRLATQGIPDGAGIRPTVWKLLLGYLPNDRGYWASELAKKRSQYKVFKDEVLVVLDISYLLGILKVHIVSQSEVTWRLDETAGVKAEQLKGEGSGLLGRSEITHGEHPLSLGKSSVWNQFFQDSEIIEQIDRDVKRTHPDMHFFSGDSSFARSNQESVKRILIVFAKLNPGIRYVQGMNEVLAPLFYVFRSDPDEDNA
ncbi:hypothetical protein Taro_008886, partial [Colocasia esculenta]|nr:hypothetical protein [Colocasia esculenta]